MPLASHSPAQAIRAFIFARGGSKGIPRKNVQPVGGKPLIAHAIHTALQCPRLGRVTVSTDDPEIAEVAREYGAEVPFVRPAALAGDTSSEWLAWRHAIEWVEQNEAPFDVFVSLPATSPFRTVGDIQACIDLLASSPAIDIVVTVRKAERSPFFNMVKLDAQGCATLVMTGTDGAVTRRQDAPAVFDMTTIAYVARTGFIKTRNGIFEGRVGVVEIPAERALDIDTPYDLKLARLLFSDLPNSPTVEIE
ncbi:MAG: acylneuraminate cytidylyltransferase [Massilia sp.]|nr:acylneuraminate cytidylyltransferase [Massilia sp.]